MDVALEPADQQQRVVRTRAEHKDRQDALALTVDGEDPGVGEEVDDGLREHQG